MSNKLFFLGTGPVGGVSGRGKTKRLETSTFIKTPKGNILIDISEDFKKQARLISKIDAILITHGHRDAIGGISQLRNFVKSSIPLYTLPETIRIIKRKFKQTDHLKFYPLKPFKPFQLFGINPVRKGFSNGVKIIPFKVRHSIQKGFPTLGFKFYFPGGYKLTYISDTGGWSAEGGKKVQNLISGSDLLVLDGAMWGKKLIAHLDMKEVTPQTKSWGIKKLIFTQIGRTAPSYEILKKELKKMYDKAQPAYDGMEILLKK